MSDYTSAVPFFRKKVQLHGKHTEFPSQTKILLTILESSQLAHFLFFTAGITRLYHESFFLQGVSHREHSSRSAGMSKLYSKSCCQETKTSFRTSKATSSYTVSEYEQVAMVQPYTDSSWSTHFYVAQAHKTALSSHRMECKICSECCPPSHCKSRYKNRFSSSASFPLPIFKLMQSLTFNHHCSYCSICILLIHTLVSPQTEETFAVKSTALSFHLWIQTLLEATKGSCTERTLLKHVESRQYIISMFSFR